MTELPANKFRIFYDHDAGHYRVFLDEIELTMSVGFGGIKVDFSKMEHDWDAPEVTLTFPAIGGLEFTLPDGSTWQPPVEVAG